MLTYYITGSFLKRNYLRGIKNSEEEFNFSVDRSWCEQMRADRDAFLMVQIMH